jgi:hypothetical protein
LWNPFTKSNSYGYRDCDCNGDSHCNRNGNSNCNGDRNSNGHGHASSFSYTKTHSKPETAFLTKAPSDPTAPSVMAHTARLRIRNAE